MPDPNQSDPNNQQPADSQQTSATPVVPTTTSPFDQPAVSASNSPMDQPVSTTPLQTSTDDAPSPFLPQDDAPPIPDFQAAPAPDLTTSPVNQDAIPTIEPSGSPQTPVQPGSAAPAEFPTMVSSPKKKFGGGKVIATILGLFVLVGGLGAGILLTQQQQILAPKAAVNQACYDDCRKTKGTQVCTCQCGGECTRPDSPGNEDGIPTAPGNDKASCEAAGNQGFWCAGCGGFCLSSSYQGGGCNQAQQAKCGETIQYGTVKCIKDQYGIWVGDHANINYGSHLVGDALKAEKDKVDDSCFATSGNFGSGSFICPVGTSGPCTANNGTAFTGNLNCFCGVIQVDSGGTNTTYTSQCGCGGGTPTPTATPTVTAQCQNIKAYNATWTELTAAQLKTLTVGSAVNFCVSGVATAGNFDRAKFTINGAAQAETTTKRPSSQDFCQTYTIPAGVNAFAITAQIHHVTLGYK